MPDWFTEIVEQVSDEVVTSSDTTSRLALTDRVTATELEAAAVASETELRTQFADNVRTIQQIRNRIQDIARAALDHEWQAILVAEQRAQEARDGVAVRPSRIERLRQILHISRSAGPASLSYEEALEALASAQKEYDEAYVSKKVGELDPIRKLNADMAAPLPRYVTFCIRR